MSTRTKYILGTAAALAVAAAAAVAAAVVARQPQRLIYDFLPGPLLFNPWEWSQWSLPIIPAFLSARESAHALLVVVEVALLVALAIAVTEVPAKRKIILRTAAPLTALAVWVAAVACRIYLLNEAVPLTDQPDVMAAIKFPLGVEVAVEVALLVALGIALGAMSTGTKTLLGTWVALVLVLEVAVTEHDSDQAKSFLLSCWPLMSVPVVIDMAARSGRTKFISATAVVLALAAVMTLLSLPVMNFMAEQGYIVVLLGIAAVGVIALLHQYRHIRRLYSIASEQLGIAAIGFTALLLFRMYRFRFLKRPDISAITKAFSVALLWPVGMLLEAAYESPRYENAAQRYLEKIEAEAEEARKEAEAEAARRKERAEAEAARRKKEAETARKEAEAEAARRKKEAETARKEAEAEAARRKKEAEAEAARRKEEKARIKEQAEEARRKEENARRKEEEARRKEKEARSWGNAEAASRRGNDKAAYRWRLAGSAWRQGNEKAARKEEEAARREEETARREEKAQEARRKEEEARRKEEEDRRSWG